MKLDKEFEKLVAYCRKNGIQSLKSEGVELSFHPGALFPESNYKRKQKEATPQGEVPVTGQPFTEDELIDWSAGQIPEGAN